ncbi:MAG: hypothetical protein A2138_10725 [Deltaproteobacteria bacterium RBG_16_71_12]|nr:MAG: hypothetical protein A2138_10725 [Deltaproteobacteria bacterium RBG_16_71_12]
MPAPSAQRARHVELVMELCWRYSSGAAMERFCLGLRERRIEALRCDRCGRRQLPPRPMCGDCRARMSSWVRVADQGALVAWTIVHVPAMDGRTGRPRGVPYAMGLVRLDGADTTLNHFLRMPEATQPPLALGARVRAVWRADRRGAIDDIVHFEVMP